MQPTENNSLKRLKYSTLGILSYAFSLFTFIPIILNLLSGGLLSRVFNSLHAAAFIGIWNIVFPVTAFVLAIIDLRKPNRLKGLSKAALVISSIVIAVCILIIITLTFAAPEPPYSPPQNDLAI